MPSTGTVFAPQEIPPLTNTLSQSKVNSAWQEAYLPTKTIQSHASNLLRSPNGDLLAAWFGGKQEGIPDICIYTARLPANSNTWEPAEKQSHDDQHSEQNPVLFQTPEGPLWLLWTSQDAGNQDSAIVKKRVSSDGGRTWGELETLFDEPGTFIRQPLVVLQNGTWVLPIFRCRSEPGERWIGNDDISCIKSSRDQGKTWQETVVPKSYGAVHMAIVPLKSGTYLGIFRSRWADFVYTSVSEDGVHWSVPKATELPNPNAGIGATTLDSGKVVLIYNHSSAKGLVEKREGLYDDITPASDTRKNQKSKHPGKEAFWGAPRAPLCIATSNDDGKTWVKETLEDGDGFCMTNNSEQKLNRELSYPSIVPDGKGGVHVAFTFWRQTIKYVHLGSEYFEN